MSYNLPSVFRKSEGYEDFFLSYKYPLTVAVITLFGYVSGLEFHLNFISIIILCFGILLTRSALPILPVAAMYLFSISPRNSPESHFASDYYHSPARIFIIAALLIAAVIVSLYVIYKNGGFRDIKIKALPMARAAALFSSALLLGGAFSHSWEIENTLYALMLIFLYFGIFYFFFLVFLGEVRERVISYLIYTAAAMALVLIMQTVHLYITSDGIIKGGEIVKDEVLFGWGMWTMAGQFLAVTIPLCFLGVIREKRWLVYFIIASLALLSVVFTLSRNALLVGLAVYLACALICCFFGKHRRGFRISALCIFSALLLIFLIFNREILTALADYLERGFSDNGRFALWAHGIREFLDAPIFGKGFFGLQRELDTGTPEGFTFYPRMMHNTVVQLLGSSGIFGLFAYAVYRAESLMPFLRRPSVKKTMLLLTLLVVIVGSLIDNFLFLPKHLIFYSITLAAGFRIAKEY